LNESLQATFAATLVDEWVRCGVTDAVVSPGSRSTPLAVALYRSGIQVHVVLDERCGGFVALGLAKASRRAVVVATTSGSAVAELHPAVVEADLGGVPLVVATADRPPELHGVGAAQTCDQRRMFGPALRWEHDPGVARPGNRWAWRSLAARALTEATSNPLGPGPVHLNLPFVEPLVGEPGELPAPALGGSPYHDVVAGPHGPPDAAVDALEDLAGCRGLIVAGFEPGVDPDQFADALVGLSSAMGWPLLADPLSGCRSLPVSEAVNLVAAADSLLRVRAFAEQMRPEVVVRFGRPWASRVLGEWLASCGALQVRVDPFWSWQDPGRIQEKVLRCDPVVLCRALQAKMGTAATATTVRSKWLDGWVTAERNAQEALEAACAASDDLTGPMVARALLGSLSGGDALVVSSSTPVREVEWFTGCKRGPYVLANRGVNGIDGVVSTACGVARWGGFSRTFALVGDLAFLHDAGALTGFPPERRLTVVVVDNGGGGIFDLLPPSSVFDETLYETLFRTPQSTDPLDLARAHRCKAVEVGTKNELADALASDHEKGARVIVVRVDPASVARSHRELHEAVAGSVAMVVGR